MSTNRTVQIYKHYMNRANELCVITGVVDKEAREIDKQFEVYNTATKKFYRVDIIGRFMSHLKDSELDLVTEL